MKSIGAVILSYLMCLGLTDIAGALLVTVLPGTNSVTFSGHSGYGSIALYYVVWGVAGCIAGAFFAAANFDPGKQGGQVQKKPVVIFTIALLLSAMLILFFYLVGEMVSPDLDYSGNYYVPGNRNLTYVFFISFLLVTLLLLKTGKKGAGNRDVAGRILN